MKTVCITANDDGSYTVEVEGQETEMEPGAENGMADMEEDQAEGEPSQTVGDISEALSLAEQMLSGTDDTVPSIEGEDEFVKGFKQARGAEVM